MNEFRQRAKPQQTGSDGFLSAFKQYDAYAKPLEDFRIKTATGATEFTDWYKVDLIPSLSVDKSRKEKMQINLNMTFPNMPCFMLSIDVMDVSGSHQNGVDHLMHKSRIDAHGNVIEKVKGELGEHKDKTKRPADYCGSCYGAPKPSNGCCNSCEDVRNAYRAAGWTLSDSDRFEQCNEEGFTTIIKEQAHEGCNVEGFMLVSKVQGNFHFAPGSSFEVQGMHAHDLVEYQKMGGEQWRFTHTIHHLSFGEVAKGLSNPLDNVIKTANIMYDTYQYYIKVVTTDVSYLDGRTVKTNQFSATEHHRDVTPLRGGLPSSMPGVFFNFDISPMLIHYQEYRKPFTHFLTDVCAVVGGVFTVAGLIDGFLHSAVKIGKKVDLGKQT